MTSIAINLIRGSFITPVTSGLFEHVIGQDEARSSLDFFLRSHSPITPFPTLLFTGGHGLGKTFFGGKVATALGRQFLEVNCGNMKTSAEFINLVLEKVFKPQRPTVILMDEAHSLSTEIETILLTLLNPTSTHINNFVYQGINIHWDMTLVSIIFSTTDGFKIFRPLRNRCQEIYFHPYSDDDLYQIVKGYVPDISLECSKKDLALTCRGRARDAYVWSQNIRRILGIFHHGNNFTQSDLESLKGMLGVLPMGLKRPEVEVLRGVMDHGPISASNLAIKLMVSQENIEEELEIRLRELGMIDSTSRGRTITQAGKDYLEQYAL